VHITLLSKIKDPSPFNISSIILDTESELEYYSYYEYFDFLILSKHFL